MALLSERWYSNTALRRVDCFAAWSFFSVFWIVTDIRKTSTAKRSESACAFARLVIRLAQLVAERLDRELELLALGLDPLKLVLGVLDLRGVLALLLLDLAELAALLGGGASRERHRDERHQGDEHGETKLHRRAEPTLHQRCMVGNISPTSNTSNNSR